MPNLRELAVGTGVQRVEGRLRDRQIKESALLELIKARDPSPTMYLAAVPARSAFTRILILCSGILLSIFFF